MNFEDEKTIWSRKHRKMDLTEIRLRKPSTTIGSPVLQTPTIRRKASASPSRPPTHSGLTQSFPASRQETAPASLSRAKVARLRKQRCRSPRPAQPGKVGYKFNTPVGRQFSFFRVNYREGGGLHPCLVGQSTDAIVHRIFSHNVGTEFDDVAERLKRNPLFVERLEAFVAKLNALRFKLMLDHHCPKAKPPTNATDNQVLSFLRATLWRSRVLDLFGSSRHNDRHLKRCLNYYICRPKGVSCCLGQLVQGFNLAQILWLRGLPTNVKEHIVAKLIAWMLVDVVHTIIISFFHVTDSTHGKSKLAYFRKSAWESLCNQELNKMKTSHLFSISREEILKIAKHPDAPQPYILRFIPKKKMGCVRPICRKKNASISKTLMSMKVLLKKLNSNFPVHTNVSGRQLMDSWQSMNAHVGVDQLVYWVAADISDAYGSVVHSKLRTILSDIENVGHLTIQEKRLLNEIRVRLRLHTVEFVEGRKKRRFLVRKGLLQGDNLSANLSDIYYGHLTKTVFSEFVHPPEGLKEVFLRGADDFLFVTPIESRARGFLEAVLRGVPEYGTTFKPEKTRTNVLSCTHSSDDGYSNGMPLHPHDSVTFWGICLNFSTREVGPDLSSYANANLAYAHGYPPSGGSGSHGVSNYIMKKFDYFCRHRLKRIFFNRANSKQNCLNSLAAIVLLALKRLTCLLNVMVWNKGRKVSEQWLWRVLQQGQRSLGSVVKHTYISKEELKLLTLKMCAIELRYAKYPFGCRAGVKNAIERCNPAACGHLDIAAHHAVQQLKTVRTRGFI